MPKIFKFLFLLLPLLLLSNQLLYPFELEIYLKQGNISYEDGKFKQAVEFYEKIIEKGFESGALYYNLGNAYYKIGNIGKSILYYEKSLKFLPRDEDVKFNLKLAKLRTADKIQPTPRFIADRVIHSVTGFFNLYEWITISLVFYILSITLTIVYILYTGNKIRMILKYIIIPSVLIFSIAIFVVAGKAGIFGQKSRAIIMEKEIAVVSAPNSSATQLFLIHEGTKVEVREKDNNWFKIKLEDGKSGWIPANSLEII
ncbi:MAG: tetratricopeptide repeat protein [Fidelibacterota bacterium]